MRKASTIKLSFVIYVLLHYVYNSVSFVEINGRRLNVLRYWMRTDLVKVSIKKPFGIDLQEVEANSNKGVYVNSIDLDSNADKTKLLKKGLLLQKVNNINVENKDFDLIMEILRNLNGVIHLIFIDKDEEKKKKIFKFDQIDPWISNKVPPYILSALLAGLNNLPREIDLRASSSQYGRRVQYERIREIVPDWLELPSGSPLFESVSVCALARIVDSDLLKKSMLGTFRIYKIKLKSTLIQTLKSEVLDFCSSEMDSNMMGLQVSNIGGYHSTTEGFANGKNQLLGEVALSAIQSIELDDYSSNNSSFNILRSFGNISSQEAWVNINSHGCYNTLHTHAGSTWSGVYYIQIPTEFSSTPYNAQLVLKLSPHESEVLKVPLKHLDLSRLNLKECVSFTPKGNSY